MVRKHILVTCDDWRLVDPAKKIQVWTDIKVYYDLDGAAFNYIITSAAKKWKDYKADLKSKNIGETLTDDELMARRDSRVNEADWKWLIDYWRSPEAEAHTVRGKENQMKLSLLHKAGNKSYARVGHELGEEQGYPAQGDQVDQNTYP